MKPRPLPGSPETKTSVRWGEGGRDRERGREREIERKRKRERVPLCVFEGVFSNPGFYCIVVQLEVKQFFYCCCNHTHTHLHTQVIIGPGSVCGTKERP